MLFKPPEIGIDLGTATILVYEKNRGIVIDEPSVVAIDSRNGKLLALGEAAQKMIGKNPDSIKVIKPLKDGVISDYRITELMIKSILQKIGKNSFFRPYVIVCIPSVVTEVDKKTVIDATIGAGARSAYLIEEPVAAAIGAGLNISRPMGTLVVDIGGGTTDIAVISLGSIVVHNSINVAGSEFDEAIARYIKKKHNVIIGDNTAEEIKKEVGCVVRKETPNSMMVKGRSTITSLPTEIKVSSYEMISALQECSLSIIEGIRCVLEQTPPELISDISLMGLLLTGGGSLLYGLDKLIKQKTGINTTVADDPIRCVVKGTGAALDKLDELRKSRKIQF